MKGPESGKDGKPEGMVVCHKCKRAGEWKATSTGRSRRGVTSHCAPRADRGLPFETRRPDHHSTVFEPSFTRDAPLSTTTSAAFSRGKLAPYTLRSAPPCTLTALLRCPVGRSDQQLTTAASGWRASESSVTCSPTIGTAMIAKCASSATQSTTRKRRPVFSCAMPATGLVTACASLRQSPLRRKASLLCSTCSLRMGRLSSLTAACRREIAS